MAQVVINLKEDLKLKDGAILVYNKTSNSFELLSSSQVFCGEEAKIITCQKKVEELEQKIDKLTSYVNYMAKVIKEQII